MSCLTDKFDRLRRTYPESMRSSLVLPLLQLMQEEKGHLTESDALFIADYLDVPAMQVVEALTWYSMLHRAPVGRHVVKVCRNIACSLMGAERLLAHLEAKLGVREGETTPDGRYTLLAVECLASCGTAPAMQPGDVEAEVTASGLRGRGGAGFPTGTKWSFVDKKSPTVYLCCNADEGEPGTFKDRWIFEHAPHQLVEGVLLAAYALGVRHAFIYIRGEFDLPLRRLRAAIEEAREAGLVGEGILGSDFACEIIVHRGAGAYVCGEESSLLTSLEGFKAYPRNKPPFPAVKGLYGAPTVVNNVETLASLPWIVERGGAAYAALGTGTNSGTRLFGISGHVVRPGLYEKETGYPLKEMIYGDCGGIRGGKALKAVIPGGSSTPILRAGEIDGVTLDAESLQAAGSMLGSGGVIVVAEGTCMVRLLQVLTRFYRHESCGQCTPCREGSALMDRIVARIVAGEGRPGDVERLEKATAGIMGNTVCALGDAAAMPVASFIRKFRDEFEYYVEHGRSMHDGRLEV